MSIADIAASAQRYAKGAAFAIAAYAALAAAGPAKGQNFIINHFPTRVDSTADGPKYHIDTDAINEDNPPGVSFTNGQNRRILWIRYNKPLRDYRFTFTDDGLGMSTTTLPELVNLRDHLLHTGVRGFNDSGEDQEPKINLGPGIYRDLNKYIAARQQPNDRARPDTAAAPPQAAKGPVLTPVYPTAADTAADTSAASAARTAAREYQRPQQPRAALGAPAAADTASIDTLVRQVPAGKFAQHSNEQMLQSYEATSYTVNQEFARPDSLRENGRLGEALTQQRELHAELTRRGIATIAYDNPQTALDVEHTNVRVIEYLQQSPGTLERMVESYPKETHPVAKAALLQGRGSHDILSLSFTEDSLGYKVRFGDYLKGKGPGQKDKLVTFEDIATQIAREMFSDPQNYSEGGKYYNTVTVPLSKALQAMNASVYQRRYHKPLIAEQMKEGEEAYISFKNIAASFGVPESYIRFSQDIIQTRTQSLINADYIERYIYSEAERLTALADQERLAHRVSDIELMDRAISDFVEQANANLGSYTISQIDSLASAGNLHAIQLSRMLNLFRSQRVSLDQDYVRVQKGAQDLAAKVQESAKEKLGDGKRIAELLGQVTASDSTANHLRGKLREMETSYNDSTKVLSDLRGVVGDLKLKNSELFAANQGIGALQDRLQTAEEERRAAERLAAEERKRAENAELRTRLGGGAYVERMIGDGGGWGIGFDARLEPYHIRAGGLGGREIAFHANPSVPYIDQARPNLNGELITITDGRTERRAGLSLGIGYDVLDPRTHRLGLELALDVSRRKSTRSRTVHEHLIMRNQGGVVVAEQNQPITQPDGGITRTTDFVISPALLATIQRLNRHLPADLKYLRFGPGAGIPVSSPEDTFIRFLLQAEF